MGEFFDAQAFAGAVDEGEALAEVVQADVEALRRRFRGLHPPATVFHAHLHALAHDFRLDAERQDALVGLPAILDGVFDQGQEERLGQFQCGGGGRHGHFDV